MKLTTLCYLFKEDKVLLLYRGKKPNDPNAGKWIGVGGHFEPNESPEECLLREVREETGLTLTRWQAKGIVTFVSDCYPTEYMHLFTSDAFTGTLTDCAEGDLAWVAQEEVLELPLWAGDRVFLPLLWQEQPFFHLKLYYQGERLVQALFNQEPVPLSD